MPVMIHEMVMSCCKRSKAHESEAAWLHVQHSAVENLYVRRSYGMTDEDVFCIRSPSSLQDLLQSAPQADSFVFLLGLFVPPHM